MLANPPACKFREQSSLLHGDFAHIKTPRPGTGARRFPGDERSGRRALLALVEELQYGGAAVVVLRVVGQGQAVARAR